MSAVNERAAITWTATLLGRGSAVHIGSNHPGRLWVGEVLTGDHGRADVIELGPRVMAYAGGPPAPFREHVS